MARNIPLFAIAATPILSSGAQKTLHTMKRWQTIETNIATLESNLRGAFWVILVSVGMAIFSGYHFQVEKKAFAHFDERVFPVAAVDWLSDHPQTGNVFNDFNWGGYLIYRLWPGQKVFLDSQTDFYGEGLVKEYDLAISAQEGWQEIFDKYEVEWAILPPSAPLTTALRLSNWKIMYEDATAVILREP